MHLPLWPHIWIAQIADLHLLSLPIYCACLTGPLIWMLAATLMAATLWWPISVPLATLSCHMIVQGNTYGVTPHSVTICNFCCTISAAKPVHLTPPARCLWFPSGLRPHGGPLCDTCRFSRSMEVASSCLTPLARMAHAHPCRVSLGLWWSSMTRHSAVQTSTGFGVT